MNGNYMQTKYKKPHKHTKACYMACMYKMMKAEYKLEKADNEEQDETMDCCDKAFSDGYIRGLEVGLSYLKPLK